MSPDDLAPTGTWELGPPTISKLQPAPRTYSWRDSFGSVTTLEGVGSIFFAPRHVAFYDTWDRLLVAEHADSVFKLREVLADA